MNIAVKAFVLVSISVAAGLIRSQLPGGISFAGRWPTSTTTAQEAYAMMAKPNDPPFVSLSDVITLHQEKKALFIDARTNYEFKLGHIPGARSLPFYELDTYQDAALAGLTSDSPVVIYCEGIGCELSFFLGRELQAAGYTGIKIFYGGYPEWKDAGLALDKELGS